MYTKELKVKINRDDVFRQIDCFKDSDFYDLYVEEYEEILDEMYSLCSPVCLLKYDVIGNELAKEGLAEGTPVMYVLYSIGDGISKYSTNCFKEGDYVKGMLSDAMADSALFSLEKEFLPYLREQCGEHKVGIKKRLEAPGTIPMIAQKVIWEKTEAEKLCGIGLSTGFMFDPVKSNGLIYVLTDNENIFMHQHDCRHCPLVNCKARNIPAIPVQVIENDKKYIIYVNHKESILDALMKYDSSFTAVCGGAGKCGKCKIQVLNGNLHINMYDKNCFTKEELESGMRLSCKAYPDEPLTISVSFKGEKSFEILNDFGTSLESVDDIDFNNDEFGIAIDIGTTTIAVLLMDITKKKKMTIHSAINHQRNYGADVISRIKISTEGKKDKLQKSIQKDLTDGIDFVINKSDLSIDKIKEIVIAGNTTMIHLLMGYDCKSLGEFPFKPYNTNIIEGTPLEILGKDLSNAVVKILPAISAFVGGDIVSGLYSCDSDIDDKYSLLIDLGTNGELALGNKYKLLVTSTAAGPAFEGGNIKWGVGSIEGAIAGVKFEEDGPVLKTIGDKTPTGICGTGVIEAVSELVRTELVDETGCLDDDYFEDGYPLAKTKDGNVISFTQQDIREIQLAKAAIRAGIETLILRYGITKDDISNVYIAGGFGVKLDCEKAIQIGMIPEEFEDKISAVGNSSLGGAVKCLLSEDVGLKRCALMVENSDEINLSSDKDFNNFYMEHMYFEIS